MQSLRAKKVSQSSECFYNVRSQENNGKVLILKRNHVLKLSLPPDLSYLHVAQMVIREAARQIGFAGDDLYEIDLAAEEAIANVMAHAFDAEEQENFDIICERDPLGLKIIIKEKGLPFDPGQIHDYKPPEDMENIPVSGLGTFLMKKVMNEVSFHNLGMGGKETHLIKYLPARNIELYLSEKEIAEAKEEEPTQEEPTQAPQISEKIAYQVRRMEPAEAVEIARCAYKSHGYTFFDDHIYYPERMIELNETEEMISAVAVTDDNIFMGHSALLYPSPKARIAEFTFAFVNREYRGQGCLNKLAEFLFNCPKKTPLDGLYVYSVTNHEFTQRSMARFGIRDCGLLLASSPETWIFKGMEAQDQRITVALSFKYLTVTGPLTLYPPSRHRSFIAFLYRNIGAPDHCFALCDEAGLPPLAAEGDIRTEVFLTEDCAEIHVISYGANVLHEVRKTLRDLCLKSIAAIQLLLNLEDPRTCLMTAEFEKMGFFFSGILPMASVGEALILQYLNNVSIDYDKIMLYSDEARQIRDYVRENNSQWDMV